MSTAKEKTFKELVARVEAELDLRLHHHSLTQLAVKFGGEGVQQAAEKHLKTYKVRSWAGRRLEELCKDMGDTTLLMTTM